MMSVFQMIIVFHALVGAFGSGSGVVDLFPFPALAWWEIVQAGIGFHGDGERPAEFGGRAGRIADAFALLHTGTAEFKVAAFQIRAVWLHVQSGGTDGKAVGPSLDCVGFRRRLFGVAGIEVDEGDEGERLAKRVNGHYVVSGIQRQAGRLEIGEKAKETEESFAKSVRIMFRRGVKERKKGQIALCVGNQIQIVAGIIKVAGRIPANIAVRLGEKARTGATGLAAAADFMAAFPGGCDHGRSVSRKGQVFRRQDAAQNGLVEETGLKDRKKRGIWLFVEEKVREG